MKNESIRLVVAKDALLLDYLYNNLADYPKKKVKSLLRHGNILVNDEVSTKYDKKLKKGTIVKVMFGKVVYFKTGKSLPIIYEDNDLIVINKPAGLLTVATAKEREKTAFRMVSDHVKAANKNALIFVVHRLDRDTSGIVVFAKTESMKNRLQDNWNSLIRVRNYVAVVEATGMDASGTIHNYLKEDDKSKIVRSTNNKILGKEAITRYEKLKESKDYTLLNIRLETGRKNQIRVHMAELGHSVVGDKKYNARSNPLARLGLHANILEFKNPETQKIMHFEVKIPPVFLTLFKGSSYEK